MSLTLEKFGFNPFNSILLNLLNILNMSFMITFELFIQFGIFLFQC